MYYMNTNEELLGKNNFKVSKTISTKALFKSNLEEIINEICDSNPSFDRCEYESTIEGYVRLINDFLVHFEKSYVVPSRLEKLAKLFKNQETIMDGVALVDWDYTIDGNYACEDYEDNHKLSILKKGDLSFPYIQIYSSAGDNSLTPVADILYFDEDEKLNLYVPIYGNTVLVDFNECIGGMEWFDVDVLHYICNGLADSMGVDKNLKEFLKDDLTPLIKKSKEYLNDYRFLEAYRQKFGVVKVRHNKASAFNDDYPDVFLNYLMISKRRIKEDILSNIS